MDRSLALLSILAFAVAASYAAQQPAGQAYWSKVLPNTPMPSAIKDILTPDSYSDDKSGTAVTVGKGGVNVNTGKPKPGGTSVNVGHGGVNVNTGKGSGTNVNVGHGGVNVNTGTGKGTSVNVGHGGGVSVNTGKGKPGGGGGTHVNVGKGGVNVGVNPAGKAFVYKYAASETQIRDDPTIALFFLEKDIRPSTKLTLDFTPTTGGSAFISRREANSIPFASAKLPQILNHFTIDPNSAEAGAMKQTLSECEMPAMDGESKHCATSLESMVEFSTASLGTREVIAVSTTVSKENSPKQRYTITGVKKLKLSGSSNLVVCHAEPYAYAVFYCHATRKTEAYAVSMVAATPAEKAALVELGGDQGAISAVEMALRRISEENGGVQLDDFTVNGKSMLMVWKIDRNKLLKELPESSQQLPTPLPMAAETAASVDDSASPMVQKPGAETWMPPMFPLASPMVVPRGGPRMIGMMGMPRMMGVSPLHRPPLMGPAGSMGAPNQVPVKPRNEIDDLKEIEELVNKKTFRETQKSKTGEELLDLIHRPTAKETAVAAKFKSKGGSQVKEYCTSLTKEDCRRQTGSYIACEKVHFRRIIAPHTDTNLGDCSFLDTCRHTKTCKYVHYELDQTPDMPPTIMGAGSLAPPRPMKTQRAEYCSEVELGETQWINCDIRNFRMDILGQFGVIMADPPWDIHMELPYGTMADDEMRNLNVPALQTDGLIFLWVTGRAMELGRECLELWGYKRVEEIIWVKTNQLQRIIRTGRTGHWLNHSKEHCLVGLKGQPLVNRNIDTDVIVAEVRETSRKPDEMYPMLERISPRTRKLELFARMHNTHAGWLSLGNQLHGARLVDEGLRARFKAAYPDVVVQPPSPPRAIAAADTDSNIAQMNSPFTSADAKQQSIQYGEPAPQGGFASSDGKNMTAEVETAG